MKIYLRVHKDQGYHVAHLWSKHIKEQIIETVNFACDNHDGCIGEPALFPTFWQQEIHSRRLYVGDPKKCKYWLNPPMYALSFVWEKADFDFEDDYYWLCDNAKLPYDFTCQPSINDQYTDDVYIGSYVKGQTEPLTLFQDFSLILNMKRMEKYWLTICLLHSKRTEDELALITDFHILLKKSIQGFGNLFRHRKPRKQNVCD